MAEAAYSILLSDPDVTTEELDALGDVLRSNCISSGTVVEEFEEAFAQYLGRKYAVAVPSGTIGLVYMLHAYGIGPGDEVITTPYSFRETTHAISIVGAKPVLADIDYWTGTLPAAKAEAKITPKTKAIIASNVIGHPASWDDLRALATRANVLLLEDSTEAIGSKYHGALVGTFGDSSVFDFSQPGPLVCGEGGMVVTDSPDIAAAVRWYRTRKLEERQSVVLTAVAPYQAGMSNLSAALGLAQLKRLEMILAKRKMTEEIYLHYLKSYEGIKPPYIAPEVDEVHWFLYVVHLGTRFSRSSRDAILDDMHTHGIQATAYCNPLHYQRHYYDMGYRRANFLVTEKIGDRAIALPFHSHLSEDEIEFIVSTMKESSINIGAGVAIYL